MRSQVSPVLWGGPCAGESIPVDPDSRPDHVTIPLARRLVISYLPERTPATVTWAALPSVLYVGRRIALGDQVWILYVYAEWADSLVEKICRIINQLPWLWWWA